MTDLREEMQQLFQDENADRDEMREKMTEMRKKADQEVLATLTAKQQKQLEELKGDPFELPAQALRGGGRGGRGGGGGRPQRQRGGQPDA